jgi:release factor glutamine methyltransferase
LRQRFAAAGIDTADLDVRLLIEHVTGADLTTQGLYGDREVLSADAARLNALCDRRVAGEPVARLLGAWDFWGRRFALSASTLVPRPDTETVVEVALRLSPAAADPVRFADIGTGTGILAITLAAERPAWRGVATDLAGEALATAAANAATHAVEDRVLLVQADLAAALAPDAFDLVVSNPPYIATGVLATLSPEVRLHDPTLALDGGADGADLYRWLIPQAHTALRPGGWLVLEIGSDQGTAVAGLLHAAGFEAVAVVPDLAGRDRVAYGRKSDHCGG